MFQSFHVLQAYVRLLKKSFFFIIHSRTSMARTLMAHSPGLARTINMVPTGHFRHNPPWMAGTTPGYNYFS